MPVLTIGLSADTPSNGVQEIHLANLTGSGGAGPLFFASADFSAVLSVTGDYPANYYESVNGTVSQIEATAPEPRTLTLVLPMVLLAARLPRRVGTLNRKRPN